MSIYTSDEPKWQPYFYVIGWSRHDVWYQGIQYGKGKGRHFAHPSNLWNTYFTSSPTVHEFASKHGDPDIIEILTFETAEEAIKEEERYQRECDVLNDPRWLNKNISGAILMDDQVKAKLSAARTGVKHSVPAWNKGKRYKQKPRQGDHPLKGRKRDPELIARIMETKRLKKIANPEYGSTPESRAKASQVHKGKTISEEHRAAISAKLKGRRWTEQQRARILAAKGISHT